ncbi:hypothetical protein CAL29_06560 [Bordetella genomosp. 10]|uniref:Virulence sensor protein BvgS n=1 Tax=Bordetella genomosp. 10 TaxID=1416804 RepID=A0A261SNY5_9BORD|nr:ATP-binding protein [Bordetella genomosp. 10]OZI38013.1 hypothetical protein CAL29_06560 [Bordetella genomosp. 10]
MRVPYRPRLWQALALVLALLLHGEGSAGAGQPPAAPPHAVIDDTYCAVAPPHGRRAAPASGGGTLLSILYASITRVFVPEPDADDLRCWTFHALDMDAPPLPLTAEEAQWIETHPSISAALAEPAGSGPDGRGLDYDPGLVHEFLAAIARRTGLRIEITRVDGARNAPARWPAQRFDLLAPVDLAMYDDPAYATSAPLVTNGNVLLVRQEHPGADVPAGSLANKHLAVVAGSSSEAWLAQHHPEIMLVRMDSDQAALDAVVNGWADAAVLMELRAKYALAHGYASWLRIGGHLPSDPSRLGLAVSKAQPLLRGIVDKALASLTPTETAALIRRWRAAQETLIAPSSAHRRQLHRLLGAATVLALLLVAWNGYLRRQIRQRKRAERALNDQLEFMRVLINGTPYAIYVRDTESRLVACNQRYLEEFAVQREQVMNKTLKEANIEFITPEDERRYQAIYSEALREGRAIFADREGLVRRARRRIHHWVLPYNDSSGGIAGIIGGWIDVSDRVRLLNELQAAKELAEAANRAKTEFLVTASHEIRTPMNAISGMLELALKGDEHALQDYVTVAYTSTQALLAIVGNILDIEKIESDRLELLPERVSLAQLAESVQQMFDCIARGKGIALKLTLPPGQPDHVLIDPTRFKQILSNLVSNAVKFTAAGQVELRLDTRLVSADRCAIDVRVADTGMGIGAEDQRLLFQPFTQTREGARTLGGTGMGLCITRRLVELMGGEIHLRSTPGVGTEVRFSLEAPRQEPPEQDDAALPAEPEHAASLHVLIVDDNAPNRLLLRKQMEHLGHRVVQANSGDEAWRAWRPGAYDLVMTDCNMAHGDGHALARRIRAAETAQEPRCVIFAYTANARQEEIQRCRASGMDACLFKPVGLETLRRHLRSHIPRTRALRGPWRDGLLFDPLAIDHLCGGNVSSNRAMFEELLRSGHADARALAAAAESGDARVMDGAVHAVLGVARMIDAQALMAACAQAQRTLADAGGAPCSANVLDDARRQLAALLESVQAWLRTEPPAERPDASPAGPPPIQAI